MKGSKLFVMMLLILGAVILWTPSVFAEEKLPAAVNKSMEEMPILTGEVWQKMTHDEKIAFVWGMGHMLSIERNVIAKNPEVKKAGFSGNMANALAGISMNEIVREIDKYYSENQDDMLAPVIEVIWDDIARPRIAPDTMMEKSTK